MSTTICTIGFAGKTAEEFFTLLMNAGVQKLIDIRENRVGQLSGFAKYPDIAFFLDRLAGIAYSYEPLLAPSPEIRKTYRTTKDWSLYETSALRARLTADASITLDFDGEALARAAVDRLERIIKDLETISGMKRDAASAIALHQPNPRLVETLLRRTGLPADKVPHVAKVCGNLGSSTCGVALSMALDVPARKLRSERGPIMVASVGPGMLWAGAILS